MAEFQRNEAILRTETAPEAPSGNVRISEILKYGTNRHRFVLSRLNSRIRMSKRFMRQRYGDWDIVDDNTRMFADLRRGWRRGDGSVNVNESAMPFERGIVIPFSYAILQVRLTALMAIFLAREPLIQITGRGPEDVRPADLLEGILKYDFLMTNANLMLYGALSDAERYGIGIINDEWNQDFGWKVDRSIQALFQNNSLFRRHANLLNLSDDDFVRRYWGLLREYNKWLVVDPRRYYPDPRFSPHEVHKFEFCGHQETASRLFLYSKSIENGGPYFNLGVLRNLSRLGDSSRDFGRNFDEFSTEAHRHNFRMGDSEAELDKDDYNEDKIQVRLIPKEWSLGTGTLPEIWRFSIINGQVIIRAHRAPYDHGELTYSVFQSNIDFHHINNRGTMEHMLGIQQVSDWAYASHVENMSRHINDAFVYTPSFFELGDILNPGPARHLRLNELGEELVQQGVPIGNLIHQLPLNDVTRVNLDEMKELFTLSQIMMGLNDPAMGQITRGRRTLGEIERVLAGSTRRIALAAALYDAMALKSLGLRAVANRQQFTSMQEYVKLQGMAAQRLGTERYLINRSDLQGHFNYDTLSGISPPDPARAGPIFQQLLEASARDPELAQVINKFAVVKQIVQNGGVKNVEEFLADPTQAAQQIVPDDELAQQRQRGNVIPLPQRA